jgi:hypothetical protein
MPALTFLRGAFHMSTAAQNTANQANAQHSTGPRTEQGKIAVSTNATTHGATSESAFIKGENLAEYALHIKKFSAQFRPGNCHESFLVQSMADAAWRLKRLKGWELQVLELCEEGNPFLDDDLFKKLNRTHRHMQSIERAYHRALQAFNAARKPAVPEQTQIPAKPAKPIVSAPSQENERPPSGSTVPNSDRPELLEGNKKQDHVV